MWQFLSGVQEISFRVSKWAILKQYYRDELFTPFSFVVMNTLESGRLGMSGCNGKRGRGILFYILTSWKNIGIQVCE